MRKNILDYWAGLSLATSGFALFTFLNLVIFGAVLYREPRIIVLWIEVFFSFFIFAVNIYVFWQVLVKKREVRLRKA